MAPGVRFLPLGTRRARSSLPEVRSSPSLEQLDTEENP